MTSQPWFTTTTGTTTNTFTFTLDPAAMQRTRQEMQRATARITEAMRPILAANNAAERGDSMTGERIVEDGEYPLGSVAEHPNGRQFVRTYSGWMDPNGEDWLHSNIVRDGCTLVEEGTTPIHETLDQYKQRFRTSTIGGAVSGGIGTRPVLEALRALDVPDYPLSPGMYIHPYDRDLLYQFPRHTIVQVGVPEVWEHYGLFTVVGTDWQYITGHARQMSAIGQVIEMPGIPEADWMKEEWTPEQQELVEAFMARAYDIGNKAKVSNSWCSTYEYVMERASITDAWMNRPRPMTREQVIALPVGSILYWQDDLNRALFERVEDPLNDWNVRQLWATDGIDVIPNDGDTLRHLHRNEVGWRPPSMELLDDLPIGSSAVIDGYTRTKKPDGLWHHRPMRPQSRGYAARDVNHDIGRWRVRHVGDGTWDHGTVMDAEAQRRKPEGTLFYWEGRTYWALFIRDDSADNDAGTRKLLGDADAEWKESATYLGPLGAATLNQLRVMEALPDGSQVQYSGSTYTRENRMWRTTPGGYGSAARDFRGALDNGEVELLLVGDPNAPAPVTEPRVMQSEQDLYALPEGTTLVNTRNGDRLLKRRYHIYNETKGTSRSIPQCWQSIEARTLTANVVVPQ